MLSLLDVLVSYSIGTHDESSRAWPDGAQAQERGSTSPVVLLFAEGDATVSYSIRTHEGSRAWPDGAQAQARGSVAMDIASSDTSKLVVPGPTVRRPDEATVKHSGSLASCADGNIALVEFSLSSDTSYASDVSESSSIASRGC